VLPVNSYISIYACSPEIRRIKYSALLDMPQGRITRNSLRYTGPAHVTSMLVLPFSWS